MASRSEFPAVHTKDFHICSFPCSQLTCYMRSEGCLIRMGARRQGVRGSVPLGTRWATWGLLGCLLIYNVIQGTSPASTPLTTLVPARFLIAKSGDVRMRARS